MPNLVTIIDFETTGLDPKQNCVIEAGAILYSVPLQMIVSQVSFVVPIDDNPQAHINRMPKELTWQSCGLFVATDVILQFIEGSQYLVAHGAAFDSQWIDELYAIVDKETPEDLPEWLCTYEDFIWPLNHTPCNLIQTAVNHGVPVIGAHRALTDCQLIASLFDRSNDLQGLFDAAIARNKEPWVVAIANVSFDDKDKAKRAGFHWGRDYAPKKWSLKIKPSELENLSSSWDFPWSAQSLDG
jgi:DNA polymerase-3 subunit epsilon